MPKSILIFVFLLHCLAAFTQSDRQKQQTRHYFFTHYTTKSGLVSYQVNTSVQDENGYVWIGTNDGLQRYDGVRFKTFRQSREDSSSVPSNLIWQLLIDKDKNLWILTTDGKAGIFDTRTFQFTPVAIRSGNQAFYIANAPAKKLITDEFGNLFLLVPGIELLAYNKADRAFTPAVFRGLSQGLKIRSFTQEAGTYKYWMCIDGLGLAVYNSSSQQLSFAGKNVEKEKAIEELQAGHQLTGLYVDKSRRLWIIEAVGDSNSVSCYDILRQQVVLKNYRFDTRSIGFHQVRSFFEQADGTIWVIGQQIFARYLEKQKRFEQVYNGYEEHGIDFISITSLMEDREHNMWATTGNNGIYRYNPSQDFFSNIQYISHTTNLPGGGAPVSFVLDKDGSLLVGTREDGLYRFDKNLEQTVVGIRGIGDKNKTAIWNMYASADSNSIWMGTKGGLYKYDQDKKRVSYYQPAALNNKTVKQIVEDKKGNLWLGTNEQGVFKWDGEKGKKRFDDGLMAFTGIPGVKVNKIIKDRNGLIWIGTNGQGAFVIDPANDSVVKHFFSEGTGYAKLPEQSVLSLLDYNDSLVIIGCNTRLMAYNRFRQKTSSLSGALSGFIASIEKDDDGYLWISTSTCIYRATVSNRVFLQMNRDDGLKNDYFLQAASYTLPDKRMIFGVYGAVIVFLPTAINTAPMFPDLQVTGFMVKDKALRVDSLLRQRTIVLGPEENSMIIDLSVLSYNSGYLLKYKLEGLDKDWKVAGTNYQLVYSYLPPGSYTLYVTTVDADGVSGQKTLTLSIRINAPFWKTWVFYGILFLLLVLLLFWFDSERMKRRGAIQKMRSNIAGNLHREVNTALNSINILSEMAKLKADNNPEKSKEFIGQIHIKSEHMIVAMDDMLWSIDPANDSMLKTIERLREFIETLNNGQNTAIDMLVDKNVEKLKLGMQLRHETLLLLKEFTLAQVQSGARNIHLHLHYEKSSLVYSCQFDPASCNIKQVENFFRTKDMEKRLGVIGAILSIDVNKSNVLILLKLPVS